MWWREAAFLCLFPLQHLKRWRRGQLTCPCNSLHHLYLTSHCLPLCFLHARVCLLRNMRFCTWLDSVAACQVCAKIHPSVGTCPAAEDFFPPAVHELVRPLLVVFHTFLCCLTFLYVIFLFENEWPICCKCFLSYKAVICLCTVFHLSPISCSLRTAAFDFLPPPPSSDVPHFQTILLSWLSCSVKSPVTMLWVGNTHRNTSPREVCYPSVCGSLWEQWREGRLRGEVADSACGSVAIIMNADQKNRFLWTELPDINSADIWGSFSKSLD